MYICIFINVLKVQISYWQGTGIRDILKLFVPSWGASSAAAVGDSPRMNRRLGFGKSSGGFHGHGGAPSSLDGLF